MGREPFPARPINSLLIIAAPIYRGKPVLQRRRRGKMFTDVYTLGNGGGGGAQLITSNSQVEDTKQPDFNNNQYFHPQGESPN